MKSNSIAVWMPPWEVNPKMAGSLLKSGMWWEQTSLCEYVVTLGWRLKNRE